MSLFNLPIANATAINMATPLFITVVAVLWLRHRVGPRQWLAIAAGLAGVLLVIQPRADGFNAYAWLCLCATVLNALRDVVTLRIPRDVPSIVVTLATSVAVTALAGAVSLLQGAWLGEPWLAHAGDVVALTAFAAVSSLVASRVFRWE